MEPDDLIVVLGEPVDEGGNDIPARPTWRTITVSLNTVDPGGIASLSDGLAASWDLLVRLGQVIVLVAGALIPCFWIPLIAWFVRRMSGRPASRSSRPATLGRDDDHQFTAARDGTAAR